MGKFNFSIMKFAVACLIATTEAIKLNDAPAFFSEPTWRETFPSAAGLIQTNACERSGASGVECVDQSLIQFANGMIGDEDLGEDITMKGAPYHFLQGKRNQENIQLGEQWVPVVVKSTGPLPECHGTNGPDGVNCARAVCSGTNGPHDGPSGTACTLEEPAAIPAYTTDPVAGRPYATTGDTLPVNVRDLSGTTNPNSNLGGQSYAQTGNQWVPVVVKSTGPLPECHGTNGPDGVNCARAVCSGTNGPHDGPSGTACT